MLLTMLINSMISAAPVGTKEYVRNPKDRWDVSDTIKIRIDNSVGDKLINAPSSVMALDSVHLFYEYFKGLYITSEDVTPGITGRMNRIPLSTLDITMSVYYKRYDKDTVAAYWHYSATYMASFTAVQHDYTTATHSLKVNASTLNDTSRKEALDSTLYIQGLFGVTPMIKLRKEKIQEWFASKNIDMDQIAISRVVLEFYVERFSGYDLKRIAMPLGLFYRTLQTFSSDENAKTYPDIAAVN